MAKPSDKRARTVEDAAFTHLQVFVQPVWSWPTELAQRVPTFEDLYVPPDRSGRSVTPIERIETRLRAPSGPSKLLLTGQRGSGKSWSLRWLERRLADRFTTVPASATDDAGVTLQDADVSVILLLLGERLCARADDGAILSIPAGGAFGAWRERAGTVPNLPAAPEADAGTYGMSALHRWFRTAVLRLRADAELRSRLVDVPADDLLFVVNDLIQVVTRGKAEVLILLDDLDKLDAASVAALLGRQFSVLARVNARMVLTCPASLALEGLAGLAGGTLPLEFLRNSKVVEASSPDSVHPAAVEHFRLICDRILEPSLVTDEALRELTRLSGGVVREFGRVLAASATAAHFAGAQRIGIEAVREAAAELSIEMARATQFKERRESLGRVHKQHQLETAEDRKLLDLNMLIEYVNGELWYDVHPLLVPVVESWSQA